MALKMTPRICSSVTTYAHLTAFHQGDLGFAHLHPSGPVHGDHGEPVLHFHAVLPESGRYRLFVQFQAGGTLHTAQVTLPANGPGPPRSWPAGLLPGRRGSDAARSGECWSWH